jgi:hypothetical protein
MRTTSDAAQNVTSARRRTHSSVIRGRSLTVRFNKPKGKYRAAAERPSAIGVSNGPTRRDTLICAESVEREKGSETGRTRDGTRHARTQSKIATGNWWAMTLSVARRDARSEPSCDGLGPEGGLQGGQHRASLGRARNAQPLGQTRVGLIGCVVDECSHRFRLSLSHTAARICV